MTLTNHDIPALESLVSQIDRGIITPDAAKKRLKASRNITIIGRTREQVAGKICKLIAQIRNAVPAHDKPLAAAGLDSYRYKGRYCWIMIGANDDEDALRQAARSLDDGSTPVMENLQRWDIEQHKYIDVMENARYSATIAELLQP